MRQELCWAAIEAAAGAIDDEGHDWDDDPAAWLREQRVLVTGNPKDFPMDDVTVEHWPVGT